jgi:hypothetical protein
MPAATKKTEENAPEQSGTKPPDAGKRNGAKHQKQQDPSQIKWISDFIWKLATDSSGEVGHALISVGSSTAK